MRETGVGTLLLTLAAWQLLPQTAVTETMAIVGVNLVNPAGHRSLEDATVVMLEDEIRALGPRAEVVVPEDAVVLDGAGLWLIPGLMDLHVHFGQSGTLNGAYADNRPNPEDDPQLYVSGGLIEPRIAVERTFRQFARCGITTVRSLGEYPWAWRGDQSLRVQAQRVPFAPRVVLSTMAYHPRSSRPSLRRVTSPEQGLRLLRAAVNQYQPEFLKIWWVDGRFIGEPDGEGEWRRHQSIVKALLDEAKELGLRNGVDAVEADKAKEVVRMGGNLVHGVFFGTVDEECLELMRANKTQVTSTLVACIRYFGAVAGHVRYTAAELLLGDPYVIAQTLDLRGLDGDQFVIPPGGSRFDGMTLSEAMRAPPYTEEIKVASENLSKMHKAGVTIGIGTDAAIPGVPFGASIFAEFELHRQAGMTPLDILTAATAGNAEILGRQDQLGSIAVGKRADMVLLSADPRVDISHLSRIVGVVRDGNYFPRDALNDDGPREIVTRLRNAFNNGSPEVMREWLASDVTLRDDRAGLDLMGRSQVQAEFSRGAEQGAQRRLKSVAAVGNTVVQTELWPDGKEYVIRYEVVNQQIDSITIL